MSTNPTPNLNLCNFSYYLSYENYYFFNCQCKTKLLTGYYEKILKKNSENISSYD